MGWGLIYQYSSCMIQESISSKVKTRGIRTWGGGLGLSPQSLGNLFLGQWRKIKIFGFSPSPSSIRYLLVQLVKTCRCRDGNLKDVDELNAQLSD